MSLNKKLIDRIQQIEEENFIRKFLNELLMLESNEIGQYKKKYRNLLEKYLVEGRGENEN